MTLGHRLPGLAEPASGASSRSMRVWKLGLFAFLAGICLCWVFATPLFGQSDETAQAIKAAAVARGDLVGTPAGGPTTIVGVPEDLVGPNWLPCYALQTTVSAGCLGGLGNDNHIIEEKTWVGYYPPLYYLLVGWPSLFFYAAKAIYAMRVVSALLGAALLAGAFFSAVEARGKSLLVPAVAALTTPYLLSYVSAVNPSGMEMASALCAWTSGVALVGAKDEPARRRALVRLIISLVVLAQVRDLGPLFVALIALGMAALYGFRASWSLLRRPQVRLLALAVALSAAFAGCWVLFIGNTSFLQSTHGLAPHAGVISAIVESAHRYTNDIRQLVGNFAWTDAYPPPWLTGLGLGVMALVLVLGARFATRRARVVTAALAVVAVAFPILLVAYEARSEGILGQGRYWFPVLAGVVVIAAAQGGSRIGARWWLWAAVGLSEVVIGIICFQVALDRFRFGLGQPEARAGWNPPGGADLLPVLNAVLTAVFAWWWWRASRPSVGPRSDTGVARRREHEPEPVPLPA